MPSLSDLDMQQERVYLNAPLDGVIMVKGPPGSGKTIMAFYRSMILSEKDTSVSILMYNNVLSQYIASTDTGEERDAGGSVKVCTQAKWSYSWWRSAYGFRAKPPLEEGPGWRPVDWAQVAKFVIAEKSSSSVENLHWGHLVIDEGQDFYKGFYEALNFMRMRPWPGDAPGLTIFADDNQQLNEDHNSTTREVIDALGLRGNKERCYELTKNYRNTQEIYGLAKYYRIFRMQADDPDRTGEQPEVRLLGDRADSIATITRLCKRNRGKEIGIVIPNNKKMVRQYHKELAKALESEGFTVQAYNSGSKVLTAESLEFDESSTVTVLNMASVKGLEFDVVFAAEMQSMDVSDDRLEAACKNLYVLCSRARENLFLCFTLDGEDADYEGSAPPSLGLIPPENKNLCRYLPKERWDKLSPHVKALSVPRHVD
ncbi:hypothetical protein N9216_01460 [Pseudomonadales bacterium]|nr:hypothetical protein [Pseudomonadales bacterium]